MPCHDEPEHTSNISGIVAIHRTAALSAASQKQFCVHLAGSGSLVLVSGNISSPGSEAMPKGVASP